MHILELDTPAVILDLDAMERNIERMAAYCRAAGIGLRPHIKTHKIPEIAQRQMAAGATGITAAKPSEAVVMAGCGIRDILIAYPIVSPAKSDTLAALLQQGVTIAVSIDSVEAAECLATAASRVGQTISLLVEIDVGFGRCGVQGSERAVTLARSIDRLPGAKFGGLMYYPGHLFVSGEEQDRLLKEVDQKVEAAYAALLATGFAVPTVSGGSSPTAYRSTEFTHLTEIRPGMYPLNDRNLVQGSFATLPDCALSVLTTIVSTAVQGRAIHDGGSKTFSSDRLLTGNGRGFGFVRGDPDAVFYTMSEEHGHLDIQSSTRTYKVGQRICIVPNHVCTTINMHDTIYACRGDSVEQVWRVAARGCVR